MPAATHATDVLQTTHYVLATAGFSKHLSDIEILVSVARFALGLWCVAECCSDAFLETCCVCMCRMSFLQGEAGRGRAGEEQRGVCLEHALGRALMLMGAAGDSVCGGNPRCRTRRIQ